VVHVLSKHICGFLNWVEFCKTCISWAFCSSSINVY